MRYIKIGDTTSVFFDVRLTDNISPALAEAGNQPQTSLNGASFSNNGISVLTSIGFGRYSATLTTFALSLAIGDVILTRYKGSVTIETDGDSFTIISDESELPNDTASVAYYGTLQNANLFFSQRLNVRAWEDASISDRRKSLIMSTQIIDRLNFAGDKAEIGQVLQFPRGNTSINPITFEETIEKDDNVPEDIKNATYLIAIKLLDGFEPENDVRMTQISMSKFQNAQTFYNRDYIPEFLIAGVPSSEAWNYLKPYLRDSREIQLSRA